MYDDLLNERVWLGSGDPVTITAQTKVVMEWVEREANHTNELIRRRTTTLALLLAANLCAMLVASWLLT